METFNPNYVPTRRCILVVVQSVPPGLPTPVVSLAMGKLFDTMRRLVGEEKYVIGQHAAERLEEHGIMEWQVVAGMEDGALFAERPSATPHPAVEVRKCLPDGSEIIAVWSHLRQSGVA